MKNEFEFTILSIEEIENSKFSNKATTCPTDFAKLLGARTDYCDKCCYWLKNAVKMKTRGSYSSSYEVAVINQDGNLAMYDEFDNRICIRPVIKLSTVKKYLNIDDNNEFDYVEFGEYPQFLADDKTAIDLERLYQSNQLEKTGHEYTTDSPFYNDEGSVIWRTNFYKHTHPEFIYNERKYVRVEGYKNSLSQYYKDLSNRDIDGVYWLQVLPITWTLDREHDIAMTTDAILSGIKYHLNIFDDEILSTNYNKEDLKFEDTVIYKFLNKYFAREIIDPIILCRNIEYKDDMYNDIISKKFQ